jgi:hypothetical protein
MPFDIYNWKDAFFPLVTKWFDDEYAKNTSIIESLIGVEDTKRAIFWEHGVGGVGEIPDYDGTRLEELTKKKGFKTVYETKEKAGVYRIKYKDAKFDLSGESKKAGSDMSNALYMTVLMDFYRFFFSCLDSLSCTILLTWLAGISFSSFCPGSSVLLSSPSSLSVSVASGSSSGKSKSSTSSNNSAILNLHTVVRAYVAANFSRSFPVVFFYSITNCRNMQIIVLKVH